MFLAYDHAVECSVTAEMMGVILNAVKDLDRD
jgi:hypothetical protein